ncbi:MAG: ABC transporter permease [Bacteroidales bacterium]|nr:ABC transporter permease [Bacteroidales bacterium]
MIRFTRYTHIFRIALEAVFTNRVRSMLTALGIIFGVAAVISMMAVGKGAQKEILDQMKVVGVNNIIITPLSERSEKSAKEDASGKQVRKNFSAGINLADAEAIARIIPTVEFVSPEVSYESRAIVGSKSMSLKISGITNDYFNIFNLSMETGRDFNSFDLEEGRPVCVIGQEVKKRLFPTGDPVGKTIKCDNLWMVVVGVLQGRDVAENLTRDMGISNYNFQVYAPIRTILSRVKDRSVVTSGLLSGGSSTWVGAGFMVTSESGGESQSAFNQLDKIVVRITDTEKLTVSSDVIARMIQRRHNDVRDFEVLVPELLLKQEQRTRDIFNIVLGAIASISLLVGGIGIMNIMLASVLERIKEIGVRMAVGARRRDIILQFLTEATLISLSGGILGILLGIGLAKAITHFAGIQTIVSYLSVMVSFCVSAAVGILFGFAPARKAAAQDPVTSLRYE